MPFSAVRPWDDNTGSTLSCLGVYEFVDSWTTMRLGEVWRAGAASASDQGFQQALLTVVSRVSQLTGRLSALLGLMKKAAGNSAPPVDTERRANTDQPAGLGVLSVVASRGQAE